MSERYPEHILLGSQWDAVYDVIKAMGFNPSDFTRTTTYGQNYNGMVPMLIHKHSGSEFVFDFDPQAEKHAAEWSPGEQQPRDKTTMMEWQLVLRVLSIWLENLQRELTTPNFWDWLDGEREQLASSEPTGETTNTPFSPEEQRQIAKQLDEIKELLVNNHGANPATLEKEIDQLVEASKGVGRRDWLLMFMGVGLTWTLHGLIPPEGLREMLSLALQGIGHLFGGVPQLPMP